MKHEYELEGYAYRLRPVQLTDAQFIVETRLEDAKRNKYINKISSDVKLQEAWLERYFEREGDYYFIVENIFTNQREGLIGIYDVEGKKAEWGRWVIRKGSLAAIESMDLIYRIAFEKIGLDELFCRTLVENKKVVSLHNSSGEHYRCTLNGYVELEGKQYDVVEHYANKAFFYSEIHDVMDYKMKFIMEMMKGSVNEEIEL